MSNVRAKALSRANTSTAVLVVGLVCLALWQWFDGRAIRQEVSSLRAERREAAHVNASSSGYEQQRKCAEDARSAFASMGFKASEDLAGYTNHFNQKLNKCFMDFQSTSVSGKVVFTTRSVVDVLENKEYGTYIWRNPGDKKYWEVAPSKCEVLSLHGGLQHCASNEQFTKLAQEYMEN